MSGSQEAASAIAQLERQLEDARRKTNKLFGEVVLLHGTATEPIMRRLAEAAREAGHIEGTIAAMRSPLGYGGAPAESYASPNSSTWGIPRSRPGSRYG